MWFDLIDSATNRAVMVSFLCIILAFCLILINLFEFAPYCQLDQKTLTPPKPQNETTAGNFNLSFSQINLSPVSESLTKFHEELVWIVKCYLL